MTYSESVFTITYTQNRLVFSGFLEKCDYSGVEKFFEDVEQQISDEECDVYLEDLSFLNSRGLRVFTSFLLRSAGTFRLHINPSIHWQKHTIPQLANLRPNKVLVVS